MIFSLFQEWSLLHGHIGPNPFNAFVFRMLLYDLFKRMSRCYASVQTATLPTSQHGNDSVRSCRMLLSPIFKNAAPGNLGKPDLGNLPVRSKIALPKMPSLKHQTPEEAISSASGIANDHIDLTIDDVVDLERDGNLLVRHWLI